MTIKITDVNDNHPQFLHLKQLNGNDTISECEQPVFEKYEIVEENSKINTKIVQLSAIDLDKVKNITFKIVHSTDFDKKMIAVDQITGNYHKFEI